MRGWVLSGLALVLAAAIGAGCGRGVRDPFGMGGETLSDEPHEFVAQGGGLIGVELGSVRSSVTYRGVDPRRVLRAEIQRSGRFVLREDADYLIAGRVPEFVVQLIETPPKRWQVQVRAELRLLDADRNPVRITGGSVNGTDPRVLDGEAEVARRALALAFDRAIEELFETVSKPEE